MIYKVRCIEDKTDYVYIAKTPYDAMKKMAYYLDMKSGFDKKINMSGHYLWMLHQSKTYCVKFR